MRLEVGMIIKTSYGTGPYRIKRIVRDCTCVPGLGSIESEGHYAALPPHLHLTLSMPGAHGPFYLNYHDEGSLQSVRPGCNDQLIICPTSEPVQTTLI